MTSVIIRLAAERDAEAIRDIYRPIVLHTGISFEVDPPDSDEIRKRIRSGPMHPWLVCEIDGAVAGYAYASAFRPRPAYAHTAEVSVYSSERVRRRGVAQSLYEALLGLLELQGFHTAVAIIALPNPASQSLHAALGFRRAGTLSQVGFKLQRWVDIDLWERSLAGSPAGRDLLRTEEAAGLPDWTDLTVRAAASVRS